MKKQSLFLAVLVLGLYGILPAQTDNLAYFSFTGNTPAPNTPNNYMADAGLQADAAGLYLDGTCGSSSWESSELTANSGSTINALPGVAAGKDLAMINQTANGKSFVFKLTTTGYEGLQMSFAARRTATGFKTSVWEYSTDGVTFSPLSGVSTMPSAVSTYEHIDIDLSSFAELNDKANVYLKCTLDGATSDNGSYRIDNVQFNATRFGPDIYPPAVTSVEIDNATTVNVAFNEELDPTTAESVANYMLDGAPVASAVMSETTVALTVPAMEEGTEHTLLVQNVKDIAGNVMAAPYTETFVYGLDTQFHVQTIAGLRAKWTEPLDPDGMHFGDQEYKLTGNVIITAINKSYRNQIFIQDATGALVIDDADGIITRALEVGDEITDIYGSLSDYYGQLQIKATRNCSAAVSIFNEVEPLAITLAELQDNSFMNSHQCELVQLHEVEFVETGPFANGMKYSLTQDGTTAEAVWIHIYDVPTLTGADIPDGMLDIVGVNKIHYAKYYLIPRSGADLRAVAGVSDCLTAGGVSVCPNPAGETVRITLGNGRPQVSGAAIYDCSGRLMRTRKVHGRVVDLDVADLPAGVYFVRLSGGGSSFTAKVMKR